MPCELSSSVAKPEPLRVQSTSCSWQQKWWLLVSSRPLLAVYAHPCIRSELFRIRSELFHMQRSQIQKQCWLAWQTRLVSLVRLAIPQPCDSFQL